MGLLELLIVVLLILWLMGYFGRGRLYSRGPALSSSAWSSGGSWIHLLLIIVVILVVLRLLGI
jgi:hypothetical protein